MHNWLFSSCYAPGMKDNTGFFCDPITNIMVNQVCGSTKVKEYMSKRNSLLTTLANIPNHKLVLVILKCLVDFSIKTDEFKATLDIQSRVLIETLNSHMKLMLDRLELSDMIDLFLDVCRPIFKYCLDKRSWKFQ